MSSNLLNLGSLLISSCTLIVAILALQSWKKQFNKNLQRDVVLAALDATHEISLLNFKIVDKFNYETSKNDNFLLRSQHFANPLLTNHSSLIDDFSNSIANLNKFLNRLNKLQDDPYFEEVSEEYLMCLYEIGEFFRSDELIGFEHENGSTPTIRHWSPNWLDKACDQEMALESQIEEYLLKLLKI